MRFDVLLLVDYATMGSAEKWLEILVWTKTLFESTKAVIDLDATYNKLRHDRDTILESQKSQRCIFHLFGQ